MKAVINNTILLLKSGDITVEKCDAIVNAANTMLAGGAGVDGAIHNAGGLLIGEECRKIVELQGGCPTGEAVITSGGRLPARYVIHTVGPVWQGGENGEEVLLRSCYRNSLKLAVKNCLYSIAFPSISTGVYGYPIEEASCSVLDEVIQFLLNISNQFLFKQITFVLFSNQDLEVYKRCIKTV